MLKGVSILKKNNVILLSLFVLGLITFFMVSKESLAKAATAGTQNQQGAQTASPTGTQVKNQNQVSTKNMGEETNLQVSTSEEEGTRSGDGVGLANKNPNAVEHMSTVAQKVQELLQLRTSGGIGDQVREIAQEQNQAQTQIKNQIDKIESKAGIAKTLFGPDYKGLNVLQQQLDQNQLRIEKLQSLMDQLTNQSDITAVQETIQALTDQNTALQDIINLETQTKSVFGWLVKLFVK